LSPFGIWGILFLFSATTSWLGRTVFVRIVLTGTFLDDSSGFIFRHVTSSVSSPVELFNKIALLRRLDVIREHIRIRGHGE